MNSTNVDPFVDNSSGYLTGRPSLLERGAGRSVPHKAKSRSTLRQTISEC